MNKKIYENAHFLPKGETEANWNKAVGFVPLKKQIIEYLPDENYNYTRIKVGDGITTVQDLPFIDEHLISKEELEKQIAALPQVDYEQYDETAKDYIKNRPFYDNYKLIREGKEYIPGHHPTELSFEDYDSSNYRPNESVYWGYIAASSEELPEDTIIYITGQTMNYETFETSSYSYTTTLKERPSLLKKLWYTKNIWGSEGNSYTKVYNLGWYAFINYDRYTPEWEGVDKVVIPELSEGEFKQLDEKFIPDTIATREYVQQYNPFHETTLIEKVAWSDEQKGYISTGTYDFSKVVITDDALGIGNRTELTSKSINLNDRTTLTDEYLFLRCIGGAGGEVKLTPEGTFVTQANEYDDDMNLPTNTYSLPVNEPNSGGVIATREWVKQYIKDNFATLMEEYLAENSATYEEIIAEEVTE